MAKQYGIQFSSDESSIDKIDLSPEWEALCVTMANEMKALAISDPYPEGSATLKHGIQPPGLYRESYVAYAEIQGDHFHAVLGNTEREAIWIEEGTHPGGHSTYLPGHHVMARAMDWVVRSI